MKKDNLLSEFAVTSSAVMIFVNVIHSVLCFSKLVTTVTKVFITKVVFTGEVVFVVQV